MSPAITGSITDPEFRRRRARHAAKSRTSIDHYIVKLAEAAPGMTPEQAEALVARIVDNIPPLNDEQRERLAVLFTPRRNGGRQ